MQTIADRLGVNKATVSLALRGNPSISKATRERVAALAAELNYRPDPAISAIASLRWSSGSSDKHRAIAYLCHRVPLNKHIEYSFFPGAQRRAEELGYRLEHFFLDDYPSPEAITRVLYSRGIRGILVAQIQNPESTRAMGIDWSKFTAVCCGIGRVRPPLHTVTSDDFANTRIIWEIVAQAGCPRVGAALHSHHPPAEGDWQRLGATTAALRLLSIDGAGEIPINTDPLPSRQGIIAWYEKYRPKTIVAFNPGVGRALVKHGVRIPEEAQFVAIETVADSPWSGIVKDSHHVGYTAMDILYNEIRQNHWGLPDEPNITIVQPEWNQGETFLHPPHWKGGTIPSVHVGVGSPARA